MKIQSIYISKYKNIPEKEIFFNTDLTSLIIGQNGLGKSNLLEAITLIFVAISGADEYLNLSNFDGRYFSFKLNYILRGKKINIIYGFENQYQIRIDDENYFIKEDHYYNKKAIQKISKDLIPDYFVAYYSGQNKRLEKILKKFEDDYFSGLRKNTENSELTSRRKFLYLKNYHSPILLLTLSIFKNFKHEEEKIYEDQILNLFSQLNIKSLETFSLSIKSPEWISKAYRSDLTEDKKLELGFVTHIHTTIGHKEKYPFPFWGLKSSLNIFLKCLTESVDILPYSNEDEISKQSSFQEFIEFNDIVIEDFQKEVFKHFKSPLELFYTIEALGLLNIVNFEEDLKFEIVKDEVTNLTFDLLSEGENQLLLVLGIVLITGIEETIFILDEPDTYLNPKWQREYIQLLEDFNLEDDDSHLFVTTHSPLLVQNIEGDHEYNYDLILLSRNDNDEVEFDQDKALFKNWRIDQVLSSKYFDLLSTRPISLDDYIKEKELIIYNDELELEEKETRIDLLMKRYGSLPTGESKNEIQSMLLINEVIKKFGK